MNTYNLYLNSKRCIDCHGCVVHCKANKNLPVGPILCEDPFCVTICPTEAMKNREDGIVYVDVPKGIGCMDRLDAGLQTSLCDQVCHPRLATRRHEGNLSPSWAKKSRASSSPDNALSLGTPDPAATSATTNSLRIRKKK